ncbi:MAG: hypothetical protein FJ100_22870 [Deltaproteobacteria bacterium]|nr:hypothetical protein [Deltaproteobacteria bacterium]
MKIRFWGVRGFYPASGAQYVRYGGNTAALEIVSDGGARLAIDFGTGAVPFGRALLGAGFGAGKGVLPVLLSHTHLDHTAAMPFFVPVFIPGNRIDVFGAANGHKLYDVLEALFDPHVCPINSQKNLNATITVHDVVDGPVAIDGFEVRALRVPHGRATGVAWRIAADGKSVAIVTAIDHPAGGPLAAAVDLARDVDLLLHDAAWHSNSDHYGKRWGGATAAMAVAVARLAGARRLMLTHHAPHHTDRDLDALLAEAQTLSDRPVLAAMEGETFDV